MLKGAARNLIAVYLLPLRTTRRLSSFARDLLSAGDDHLYRTVRYIERHATIPENSIIIDVGAYDGSTASYFADAFPDLQVHCIEPNPELMPALRALAARKPRLLPRGIALGARSGAGTLYVTRNRVSSSLNEPDSSELSRTPAAYGAALATEKTTRVALSTLDAEFGSFPEVLLLKLDAQGAELAILEGGATVLARTRFVLTEMNNHHLYRGTCQYYDVDQLLRRHSFLLRDIVVAYRGDNGITEYDALYENVAPRPRQPAEAAETRSSV